MRKSFLVLFPAAAAAILAASLFMTPASHAAAAVSLPEPSVDLKPAKGKQTAVFAGGCFWCTEAVFESLIGVDHVISGYAGGDAATAHYEIVGSGRTNHAESIEITYDPSKITYGQLLKVFFSVAHDPTTADHQGPDYGRQYRSAIFYKDAEQKRIAEAYIAQLTAAKVFSAPIITEVSQLPKFYPAEDYHQDFVKHHPTHPYVVHNALPKLEKLKHLFPNMVKPL